ncbi:MAG: ECF-type sigma factor [Planctomycetota bacterium]
MSSSGSKPGSENASIPPERLRDEIDAIYDELRALAAAQMASERIDHTLQATALVHEAFARLAKTERMSFRDRRHLFGAAAESMRRVLVDHARGAGREKRGGDAQKATLGANDFVVTLGQDQILDLDFALERLSREDESAAEVTRLRFFAGLSIDEVAESLETSPRTVAREWAYAKARLAELMRESSDGS